MVTHTLEPVSIEIQLKRLQRELQESLWNDDGQSEIIEAAIKRLLFLQSMGEQFDVAF